MAETKDISQMELPDGTVAVFKDKTAREEIQKVKDIIPESGVAAQVAFIGATNTTSGTSGLVPAPESGDEGKFLSGDGDWKEVEIPAQVAFVGATSETAGTSGLVPPPAQGDNAKFLSGDGTWKEVEIPKNVSCITATLSSSNWQGSAVPYTYDLSSIATGTFMIVKFNGSKGTSSQYDAIADGMIEGGEENKLYAFGDKPTVDIPVVCCVFE